MIVLFMVLTVVAVLLLVAVLVYFVIKIMKTLERIGGAPVGYSSRSSYLGKIAFGVRAIEQQTGHLEPEVLRLNEGLTHASSGLRSIDRRLVGTIDAVGRQQGG